MSRIAAPIALLFAIGILTGCSKTPTTAATGSGSTNQDQAEVADQLAQHPEYVDEEVSGSEDATPYDAVAGAPTLVEGITAAITPIHFWRHIDRVERRFEFAFGDTDSTGRPTTAWVTVHKRLLGTLNILTAPRRDSVFERHVVHKPLDDRWVRRVLLKRTRVTPGGNPVWRVASHSGVDVRSRDATTDIVSLRVQSGDVDTLITNPLGFLHIRRVLRFSPRDSVILTVTTRRGDDVVVSQWRDRRFRFHDNGDHTYTGVFRAPAGEGVRHIGVNALANGTLFDGAAAYDSEAWIFPYVVAETDLAASQP